MKNNPILILAILLFIVIACDSSSSENSRSAPTYTPQKLTGTTTSQTNLATTPTPQLKNSTAKQASVISDNAYLRQTPASNGSVVETLALGSSIEVIKQKGAWFFVHSGATKGWMHGNTIRYDNPSVFTVYYN